MSTPIILLPTDFSESSRAALEWASMLAQNMRAKLLILHVEPGQPTAALGPRFYGVADPGIADLAIRLAATKPTQDNVEYEHRMAAGDPATEIVKVATAERASMIVLGSHGRSGVRKVLMGSVAEAVMRKAPCPVLVCRSEQPVIAAS